MNSKLVCAHQTNRHTIEERNNGNRITTTNFGTEKRDRAGACGYAQGDQPAFAKGYGRARNRLLLDGQEVVVVKLRNFLGIVHFIKAIHKILILLKLLTEFSSYVIIFLEALRGFFKDQKNGKYMGLIRKIIDYFKTSKEEIKKVTWPTREQLIRDTIIVLVVSGILTLFLGGLDYLLNIGLQELIKFKK